MISALEYCHALLIVHRDLKPENLLLDDNLDIKITDFGLSNIMSPGKKFNTFCGSLHYACPEILRGEEYVGPGADIWAMGIILYCLVTGSQPWSASSSEDILNQILVSGLQIPAWLSSDCSDLIIKMLKLKEKDRITLAQMRTHPWVLKDYNEAPPSFLPEYGSVEMIDQFIIDQMEQLGFQDSLEQRKEVIQGENTQFVATYHILLNKRQKEIEEEKKQMIENRKLSEALNFINEKLSVVEISSSPNKEPENLSNGRVRSNSIMEPPIIENSKKITQIQSKHSRERSGSEPPVFNEEQDLVSLLTSYEDETKKTNSTKKTNKQDPDFKKVPILSFNVLRDLETSPKKTKKKQKKNIKVSPLVANHLYTDQPDNSNLSKDDKSSPRSDFSDEDLKSSSSNKTKRPVLKIKDIPRLREEKYKPLKNKFSLISPRRRAHQIEKKNVQDIFKEDKFKLDTINEKNEAKSKFDIHKNVLDTLKTIDGINIKSNSSKLFKCTYDEVNLKIEIIPQSELDKGVRIIRVSGDPWVYKNIVSKIVEKLKLLKIISYF